MCAGHTPSPGRTHTRPLHTCNGPRCIQGVMYHVGRADFSQWLGAKAVLSRYSKMCRAAYFAIVRGLPTSANDHNKTVQHLDAVGCSIPMY